MNMTKSLLAIAVLGSVLTIPVALCFEQTDETPVLRGPLGSAKSSPVVTEEASGKNNDESSADKGDADKATEASCLDDKSKTDSAASQTHSNKALKGGVTQTEIKESEDSLSGQANKEIAAIGISWNLFNHVITYVDPGSDLYGKVEPGKDRFLGLGKLDAAEVVRTGYNIGDVDSWVDAIIRGRDHIIRDIPVRRRPVSSFAPKFAHSFARQYKSHH